MILCIETATDICSAALCDANKVLTVADAPPGRSHASSLTVLAGQLLEKNGLRVADLDAVAVSKGPGSYTGLRIGVSAAKGLAYAAAIPLIGINTLAAMCSGFISSHSGELTPGTLLCPMIDARRMEVYNALFLHDGSMFRETAADIIDENSFRDLLNDYRIIFFGNGSEKCSRTIRHPNAVFEEGFRLSASYLHIPAVNALRNKQFEDVAYFEPYYLKEFIATIPGKLLP
ncbi:MAG TPA: tRNA (adenosine(37)-N6)-threonylcarbamoyltransferase complex dimerization subunit type 1 TsaB [Bacteroidales bacterium]|nr:tRNA (adenosine(37)-N6)-threonylcarbamoyltransferase complex dimerization subunit type 1 TsaB [Bacteroidales bacterium]